MISYDPKHEDWHEQSQLSITQNEGWVGSENFEHCMRKSCYVPIDIHYLRTYRDTHIEGKCI